MKALIVRVGVGLGLFAGSLVGGLAATGRLNHEGTANIPLLNTLFPAPPPPAEGEASGTAGGAAAGEHGAAAPVPAAPAGEVANADHAGGRVDPLDASHGQEPAAGEPQDPKGDEGIVRKKKVGRSVLEPEAPPAAGGHGEEPKDDHGAPAKEDHPPNKPAAKPEAANANGDAQKATIHAAEKDFQDLEQSLAGDRKSKYAPGGYFTFGGMPAGLTPEQINDAWQRVQGVLAEIDRRKTVLDQRETELQELADDIARRQRELSRERTDVEQLHRDLDRRIEKFQEQVKLVRNDEVAALKRNAKTIESFEPSKAAEIVQDQWKSEKGQDEVLKTFEFMDKDAVNEIIKLLPSALVQDVMKKRLRVSKEATPPGGAKK